MATATERWLSRELRASRKVVKRVGGTALLPLGILTSLFSKLVFEMRTPVDRGEGGDSVDDREFAKPLFMTLVSFVAMALCLVPNVWQSVRRTTRVKSRPHTRNDASATADRNRRRVSGTAREDDRDRDLQSPLLEHTDLSSNGGDVGTDHDAVGSPDIRARRVLPNDDTGEGRENEANGTSNSTQRTIHTRHKTSLWRLTLNLTSLAVTDAVSLLFTSHAILRLPLSSFLTLRHFQLVFAASLAFCVKAKLNALHKLGVSLSLSGAALVVLSTLIFETSESGRARVMAGFACLAVSQLAQAINVTFEGHVKAAPETGGDVVSARRGALSAARRTPKPVSAMTMLGLEGLIGVVFLSGAVLPSAQAVWNARETGAFGGSGSTAGAGKTSGLHRFASSVGEDTFDTASQILVNKNLQALLVCYVSGLVLYNVSGAQVAHVMGVLTRTKLELARTVLCWLVAARVTCGGGGGGDHCFPNEAIPCSLVLMRLAGFVMGTLGTLLFGRGDAAERQRVFERDVRDKRSFQRRRGVRRVGTAGATGDGDDGDRHTGDGGFRDDLLPNFLDESFDDDEESARAESTTRAIGFGSPVATPGGRREFDTAASLEILPIGESEYESDLDIQRVQVTDRPNNNPYDIGSGSLRAHAGFSVFGGGAGSSLGGSVGGSTRLSSGSIRQPPSSRPPRSETSRTNPGGDPPTRVVNGFDE